MNKWKQRAREWRKEANSYKGYYIDTDLTLKRERIQNDLLTERVNKELARVQGVCEVTQARLVSLQESDMLDLLEKKRLLAWQVRARDAWAHYKKAHLSEKWTVPLDDLRQAIEAGAEPKGET